MYLWSYGNSKYEIEARKNRYFSESEVMDASYEVALDKFGEMVNTVNFAEELK